MRPSSVPLVELWEVLKRDVFAWFIVIGISYALLYLSFFVSALLTNHEERERDKIIRKPNILGKSPIGLFNSAAHPLAWEIKCNYCLPIPEAEFVCFKA